MANIVSIFFILGNLPVRPAMLENEMLEELGDDVLNEP
jgi:hypothetical protein